MGAVLLIAGLMLGVSTILRVSSVGWTSGRTILLGAIAVTLLVAFVVRQARVTNPLMPLRLFAFRNASGANAIQALLVAAMFGVFFLGASLTSSERWGTTCWGSGWPSYRPAS